jgi:hypothetical protein
MSECARLHQPHIVTRRSREKKAKQIEPQCTLYKMSARLTLNAHEQQEPLLVSGAFSLLRSRLSGMKLQLTNENERPLDHCVHWLLLRFLLQRVASNCVERLLHIQSLFCAAKKSSHIKQNTRKHT